MFRLIRVIFTFIMLLAVSRVFGQCPTLSFNTDKAVVCKLDLVTGTVNGMSPGCVFKYKIDTSWQVGNERYSIPANNAGNVYLDLELTLPNKDICNYANQLVATALELPIPVFSSGRQLLCHGADTILLVDKTPNSAQRSWIINGKTYSNTSDSFVFSPSGFGQQHLSLVVDDTAGCRGISVFSNAFAVYEDAGLEIVRSNLDPCLPYQSKFLAKYQLPNQSASSINWNLPGSDKHGATSTEIPSVTYLNAGTFTAGVTLKTAQGCTYTASAQPPVSLGEKFNLSVIADKKTACLSEWVAFEQIQSGVKGVYNWKSTASGKKNTSGQNVALSFRDTGYTQLILENNHNGCLSQWKSDSAVFIKGIKAAFSSQNANHCAVPHKVQLTNESNNGSDFKYRWQIIHPQTQAVVYSDTTRDLEYTAQTFPSSWHVQLILSAGGCSDTARINDFIRLAPYAFRFNANPYVACPGQPVNFSNNTPGPSYYGYDQYSWEFLSADGKTVLGKSADITPKFQYSGTGDYPVKLKGSNPLGCQFDSTAFLVKVLQPKVEFEMSKDKLCLNDSIVLTGKTKPMDAGYKHVWRLRHLATSKELNLQGNEVKAGLSETGEWEVSCWLDIQGNCNDTLKKKVVVSGLAGKISLDTSTGCTPLTVKPRFITEFNIHYGDTSGILKYDWSSDPVAGTAFIGQRAESPGWILSKSGQFQAKLFVSNSAGCGLFVYSGQVSAGLKSDFVLSQDKICSGQSIIATNKTNGNPDQLQWTVEPNSSVVTQNIGRDSVMVRINETGTYKITLKTSRNSGCSDSISKWVEVSNLTAGFFLKDTIFSCAPVSVLIQDTSDKADSLIWITGDGKQIQTKPGDYLHSYQINSGTNKFYIQQIAYNRFGCRDTFIGSNGIEVRGPVAAFSVQNDKGCDSVEAGFVQQSKNVARFYLDYGDGSPIDSVNFSNHTYRHSGTDIRNLYTPILTVKDSSGCEAKFSHPPVQVFAVPKGKMLIKPDSIVCQGEEIVLENTGKLFTHQRWLIDQTLIAKQNPDTFLVYFSGSRKLDLVSYHDYGCYDTVSMSVTGRSASQTELLAPTHICPGVPLTYRINTMGNQIPNQWNWDFGSPGNPGNQQTTNTSAAQFTYDKPGIYYIKYSVRFANGCQIPKTDTIEVFDSKEIPVVDIVAASYNDSQHVDLHYPGIFFDYFKRILLYKNNGFVLSDTLNTTRRITDRQPGIRPEYTLSITDLCGSEGKKGRTHIPVYAQVSKAGDKTLKLDWTYYVGWNRVDRYEIYRWSDVDTLALIATLFGTEKSYLDSMLCPRKYSYKIAAVQDGLSIKAESNRVSEQPDFSSGLSPIHIEHVTINQLESVEIQWKSSQYPLHHQYVLERCLGPGSAAEATFVIRDTFYTDTEAIPSRQPIWYRVHDKDYCTLVGDAGKAGATIHLKGLNENNISYLTWSDAHGLKPVHTQQNLYYVQSDGSWKHVESLSPVKLDYQDPFWYESVNGYYQYKLVMLNAYGDSSMSNLALVPGKPQILIPSAFSPNGDGLNDEFKWTTQFVLNGKAMSGEAFECRIFNRWGQQVYMTNDLNEAWEGKINGEPLPQGLYIYSIKMTGSDFSRNHLKGTIYLAR